MTAQKRTAVRICPWTRSVSRTDIPKDYRAIYGALSWSGSDDTAPHAVQFFTCATLGTVNDTQVTLYVDDEGLLASGLPVWEINGQRFAGMGLVMGTGPEGDGRDSPVSVEAVASVVSWPGLVTTGEFTPAREMEAPDGFGFALDMGEPLFETA